MSTPATGTRVAVALARESHGWNRGGAEPLSAYRPNLPVSFLLTPTNTPGGLVLQSQTTPADLPGPITGAADLTIRATTRELLVFLEHLFGKVVKTTPTAGVKQYVFTWRPDEAVSSFWGFSSLPPVIRQYFYGLRFGKADFAFQSGQVVNMKLTGFVSQGSTLERADQETGTGTYALGPWVRGPLLDPDEGGLWFKIIVASDGTTDSTFKVVQSLDTPDAGDWTAAPTHTIYIPSSTGEGDWQDTGFGIFEAADKNLLEVLWPGAKADHSDLVAGDIFKCEAVIEDPILTYPSSLQTAFGLQHLGLFRRDLGAPDWESFSATSSTLSIDSPITARGGNGTLYYVGLDRLGSFLPTGTIVREFGDTWFESRRERRKLIELRQELVGPQIGSTAFRHTVRVDWAAAEITAQTRPAGNAGLVSETVTFAGRSDDSGSDPVTVTVITDYGFTLFADL
ncbi:MAG TPA: hypothetical protein VGS22_16490 [Thermoanaerobaculia bacterium]|jgi:hypothetical protein|nr:hypothetical protein [Thermoanaerobaculia bacterium]